MKIYSEKESMNAIETRVHRDIHLATSSYQRTREMGLNEMLLENRIIFLDMPLDPSYVTNLGTICSVVIKSLLYLDNLKRGSDIHLYINCPGGSVDDTMAIYDTMQFLKSDVCTYCIGHAASGGAVILAAGAKGKRFALPHSKVMLHQPWGGVSGQAADIKIQAEEIIKARTMINEVLSRHTGRSVEQLQEETQRDRYLTAHEAKEWGVVDEVLDEEASESNDNNKEKK